MTLDEAMAVIPDSPWKTAATERIQVLQGEVRRLRAENERLRQAVANQAGDDLCWVTDQAQAKALPEAEFLESCRRYHGQLVGDRGEATGLPTIAQLEARIAYLSKPRTGA